MKLGPEADRLGHLLGKTGALYYVTGIAGLVEVSVDISAARASSQGHLVTEKHLTYFREQTERLKRKHLRIVGRFGIPDTIRSLVSANSKREVEKLSANLRLTENDLFLMIHNSQQLGFTRLSKFSTFVPDHLKITERDHKEFTSGQPELMPRKFFNLLRERKVINVHMFENKAHWHCFFFTYSDIDDASENHWQGGSHIHYVSHVWSRLSPRALWESLEKRRERASSGMHIKFSPFDFPLGDQRASGSTNDKIFPTDRQLFKINPPIPLALLLTRGVWVASFRIPQ